MKNLKLYGVTIFIVITVSIILTATTTYFSVNTYSEDQSRIDIRRSRDLNRLQGKLLTPVTISHMMSANAFLLDWIKSGEHDPGFAFAYLANISEKFDLSAFIASNLTSNYYFSDGSILEITPTAPDTGWFYFLLENKISTLTDVGYHHGDPARPFLYIDIKLPDIDGEISGYVGAAVELSRFLKLLSEFRDTYGQALHFVNKEGMVILSSTAQWVNTPASEYDWFIPGKPETEQPGRIDENKIYESNGRQLSVNKNWLPDLGWHSYIVSDLERDQSELLILVIKNFALYSLLLLCITMLMFYLVKRFKEDLDDAFAQIKTLRGILPICSSCKKIRDDRGYWNQLEGYIGAHSQADFSHGICPDCAKRLYPEIEIYK